jgi:hypothetical protein
MCSNEVIVRYLDSPLNCGAMDIDGKDEAIENGVSLNNHKIIFAVPKLSSRLCKLRLKHGEGTLRRSVFTASEHRVSKQAYLTKRDKRQS